MRGVLLFLAPRLLRALIAVWLVSTVVLVNVLRGDFGRSIHFREPAFSVVRGYLGATVELGLTSFLLAAIVAVPVGLLSAVKRNSLIDHAAMGVALVGQSAPTFFLGILFILLLS